jgi:hypothetical protein
VKHFDKFVTEGEDALSGVIFVVYMVAGWWAANRVWFSKRTYIVTDSAAFYGKKMAMAFLLGWIFIPIAIIQMVTSNKK